MNSNGYRILGMLVWHGGKWYVRRRLPARRTVVLSAGAAAAALAAATFVGRRVAAS